MKAIHNLLIVLIIFSLVPTISAISWNSGAITFNIADSNLTDLGDVNATAPLNNQVIAWNSTTSMWEAQNQTGEGSGGDTIWQRNGTIISPINSGDDVNMSNGNIILSNNVSSIITENPNRRNYFEDGVWTIEG